MASPELQQVLGMFKMMGEKMGAAKDINEMRAVMIESPAPEGVTCTPVEAGGVSAEWSVAAGAAEDKVIVYVHGGGYVMGSAGSHRDMTGRLSKAAGARLLSIRFLPRLMTQSQPISGCWTKASSLQTLRLPETRLAVDSFWLGS